MMLLLLNQVSREAKGRADVFFGDPVVVPHLIERHPARKASDYGRDGDTRPADYGFPVLDSRVDNNAIEIIHTGGPGSSRLADTNTQASMGPRR